MKLEKFGLRFIVGLAIFLLSQVSFAKGDRELYRDATEAARYGQKHAAFMHFHSLLKFSSTSKFYKDALFATGEYYFSLNDYYDAEEAFIGYIENSPDSKALPFVLVYLLKIRQRLKDDEIVYDLKKKIIEFKQLSLLFSESKENNYLSPLGTRYKAQYFIERVDFYRDGELFEKIYY